MSWRPASEAEVADILGQELAVCTDLEREFFEKIKVTPFQRCQIARGGGIEHVFVVAVWSGWMVFWEDVEEGFEVSRVDPDGVIRDYAASQWEIRYAINALLAKGAS
jgi:hypothetical protein